MSLKRQFWASGAVYGVIVCSLMMKCGEQKTLYAKCKTVWLILQ